MRLKDPWFLLFFLIWIPMIWVYIKREKQSKNTIRYSDLSVLKMLSTTLKIKLRHSLIVLRLLSLGLLIIALARPQRGNIENEVTSEGVDIMLAVDISGSMRALDFKPKNRLTVAKHTIVKFIDKRVSDRIGLVVFAGRSQTKCPLTLDYNILKQFLDNTNFGDVEDGTAIGTAIATASLRLQNTPAKSKVIILLTDGANNKGDISPIAAANAASKLGIKIYTIGVGKEGEVPMPVDYYDRRTGKIVDTRIQMVRSDIDEQTLVDIADVTGGKFFRAHNPEKLAEIYDKIDKMEKTEIKTKTYTSWSERFYPWLWFGFILLLIEMILSNTWFRRIP